MIRPSVATLGAGAITGGHVAVVGVDLVAAVELVIVIAIAITNWWYKRKKAKDSDE